MKAPGYAAFTCAGFSTPDAPLFYLFSFQLRGKVSYAGYQLACFGTIYRLSYRFKPYMVLF